jgi:hypothetical protein
MAVSMSHEGSSDRPKDTNRRKEEQGPPAVTNVCTVTQELHLLRARGSGLYGIGGETGSVPVLPLTLPALKISDE